MKKRLLSLALTLALCLGLAVPAFASGGYEPYTIKGTRYGTPYTITFSAAKAERKTVQMREHYDIDDEYTAYQKETVTFVTIRTDTRVTVSSGDSSMVGVSGVSADGNDRYTQIVMGVAETIENGIGWNAFVTDFPLVYLYSDTGEYLITMDASATPSGFTDVKAGAYYADAVKWAVDRKITSGTSATTFSPDQTCTVAQILTFLWNANGQPEPTGRNPFSDISSGDYFYKAAVWAAGKGLVSGSKLNPNAPCTRAMVVEYLWKLAGSPSVKSSGYSAQTITGVVYDNTYSVKFSAAIIKDATITKSNTYNGTVAEERVTLISVAPGSKMTIQGTPSDELGVPAIFMLDYYKEDGMYIDPGPRGYTEIPSVVFAGSADEIKKGAEYLNLYDKAWEIMALKSESGKPYLIDIGSEAASFTDVPSSAAYVQAVAWAVEKGVTAGTSDTTFSPSDTCTRGQIVTFLHRAMG